MSLSPKHAKFVDEYLKNGNNASAAYLVAGYTAKNQSTADTCASRLLKSAQVQAELEKIRDVARKVTQVSIQKVITDVEAIRIRCMQEEPVVDKQGNQTGEWKFDSRGALKACELLGKHVGAFEERVHHDGQIQVSITDYRGKKK